jgi:hypothetical protein
MARISRKEWKTGLNARQSDVGLMRQYVGDRNGERPRIAL